ncbi:hypothetical protein [uncultured Tateyamaria sp.]|uniref:hypothetical protein n=1 Tax=uncultured Tateyamaria sp. TaxID=455651 RepID=UPI002620FFF5|nr:hypothetical protein [uncultured Tateyamaria sp.]
MTDTDPIEFDDFLLLVGKLNYSWTNTESLLIHLIAGLTGVEKEVALVVFLTLNTTRARIDLVQRLAKMERTSAPERERILDVTNRISKLAALRNRYNHCIYAFDTDGGNPRSILMRIADRKNEIKVGQVYELNQVAAADVDAAIHSLKHINKEIWTMVRDFGYPA